MYVNDLVYDEKSPSRLTWIMDQCSGRGLRKIQVKAGSSAGNKSSEGYYTVGFRGKKCKAHRIVYELFYGPIPKGVQVDHIDGDRSNNTISNLRLVTPSGNSRNRRMGSNNTSGVVGVNYYVNKTGRRYWRTLWTDEVNTQKFKCFSIDNLGSDLALAQAAQFRASISSSLDGYSDRHGT